MLNKVDSLENESDILKLNIRFQEELQNVLTLLVKENSIQAVAEEILIRTVKNCNGFIEQNFYGKKFKTTGIGEKWGK